MNRNRPVRRLSALFLLAALPALSGAIPILDLMVGDGKAAVEAHHIPGTHGFPHNHLQCVQHQASQWEQGAETRGPLLAVPLELPGPPTAKFLVPSPQVSLPRARAPPAT